MEHAHWVWTLDFDFSDQFDRTHYPRKYCWSVEEDGEAFEAFEAFEACEVGVLQAVDKKPLCLEFTLDTELFTYFGKLNSLKGSSILGSSQFSKLPPLPSKMLLNSKEVKIDPKIIILLR